MKRRISVQNLNASTVDILNVIRKNAGQEYQDLVPEISKSSEIPKVGEVLFGYPALANQFISALINRIAAVRVKSVTFNDPMNKRFGKGLLEYGETVEEIFVQIANVRVFDYDKAEKRELKRTMPDIRSALHTMSWNVQYPVTVTDTDLRKAFLSADGVTDLIARIVDSIYKAAEYDSYLLYKYLLIKTISHGKIVSQTVPNSDDIEEFAIAFRATSNKLTIPRREYNAANVLTNTDKDKQYLFLDANFAARYSVKVLASAFNMSEADYTSKVVLIDNWDEFDNDRFDAIRAESDMIDEVTTEELNAMKKVRGVLVDEWFFQCYDNAMKMTETFVAAGDYWNYFYRVQKTISYSPFANAIAFVTSDAVVTLPESLTVKITDKSVSDVATIFTLAVQDDDATLHSTNVRFVQTEEATRTAIAIHEYGAVIMPSSAASVTLELEMGGATYKASTPTTSAANVGETITFNKQ